MYVNIYIYILRFPEIGVPPNHPNLDHLCTEPHGDLGIPKKLPGNSWGTENSIDSIVLLFFPIDMYLCKYIYI